MVLGFFDDFFGKRARGSLTHITAEFFHQRADRRRPETLVQLAERSHHCRVGWKNSGSNGQASKLEQAASRKNRTCVGVWLLAPRVRSHFCGSPSVPMVPQGIDSRTRVVKKAAPAATDDMSPGKSVPEKRINFFSESSKPSNDIAARCVRYSARVFRTRYSSLLASNPMPGIPGN